VNEDKYQTRNEKSLIWVSNGLWIISRFIYIERKLHSQTAREKNISQPTGFFRNLEFFGFFGFTFFTSYLSLSFFCVSKYQFLSFFHSVRSSGGYEGIRVGFLELGKDVGDTRNIFAMNSINISVHWTRIRERWTWSKKFEKIWRKKMCSGHFSWKICNTLGATWLESDQVVFKLRLK